MKIMQAAKGRGYMLVRVRACVHNYIRVRTYTCAVELRALARACIPNSQK